MKFKKWWKKRKTWQKAPIIIFGLYILVWIAVIISPCHNWEMDCKGIELILLTYPFGFYFMAFAETAVGKVYILSGYTFPIMILLNWIILILVSAAIGKVLDSPKEKR